MEFDGRKGDHFFRRRSCRRFSTACSRRGFCGQDGCGPAKRQPSTGRRPPGTCALPCSSSSSTQTTPTASARSSSRSSSTGRR